MLKNLFTTLFFIFWANFSPVSAQNIVLPDSISNTLSQFYTEKGRVEYLLNIVQRDQYTNPPLAKAAANEAYVRADADGNTFLEAQAAYYMAWLEFQHDKEGFLGGAIAKAKISQTLFEQHKDPLGLARIYCLESALAFDSNDSLGAKSFAQKAMQWVPKIVGQQRDSMWVMGYLRQVEANFLPAKDRFDLLNQSLNLYEKAGDSIRIGRTSLKLVGASIGKQDFDMASKYALRARNAFASARYDEGVRLAYLEYINILINRYYYGPTEALFKQTTQAIRVDPGIFNSDYRFPMRMASMYSIKYSNSNNPKIKKFFADSAQVFIDMAWKAAKKTQNQDDLRVVFENLSVTCQAVGNCDTVMMNTAESFLDQLKITSAKTARIQNELADSYTLDRQRTLREERLRQNSILWGFVGFIAILSLGFGLYNQRRNNENLNRELRNRMEALRAQMNPHFISNALNAIDSLVNQNRNKEASHYIIQFSRLCRVILNNSRSESVTLAEELDMLKYFMNLEQLRMGDRLQYRMEIAPDLNTDELALPPMILQPFVENSIWHGLVPKSGAGTVLVKAFKLDKQYYQCVIEDDGIGRKKSAELKERMVVARPSLGLAITEERIEKLYKFKGSRIVTEDLFNPDGTPAGTRVTITLPIQSITTTT
jgi:two-component sensor histidine kinase